MLFELSIIRVRALAFLVCKWTPWFYYNVFLSPLSSVQPVSLASSRVNEKKISLASTLDALHAFSVWVFQPRACIHNI